MQTYPKVSQEQNMIFIQSHKKYINLKTISSIEKKTITQSLPFKCSFSASAITTSKNPFLLFFFLKKWDSPFIMTNPFFRKAEHCCGYVAEAPEVPESKSASNCVSLIFFYWFLIKRNEEQASISLWLWKKYIREYQSGIAHYFHNQRFLIQIPLVRSTELSGPNFVTRLPVNFGSPRNSTVIRIRWMRLPPSHWPKVGSGAAK